jgi:hypothetical protein
MKAKRFVKYEYYTQRNFNFYQFANYKTKTGKIVKYIDVNDQETKLRFSNPSVVLDMDNEGHVCIDNFLKECPSVLSGEWKRTDLHAEEQRKTKQTLDSARAIIEAAKMTDKDVKDYSKIKGYNLHSELDVLRAKIIEDAQNNADKFMEVHFDPEKDYRVFIIDALKEGKIDYKNNTYLYGKEAIGVTEDQVIVWLKANKDIHAVLKNDMRTEKAPIKRRNKATK